MRLSREHPTVAYNFPKPGTSDPVAKDILRHADRAIRDAVSGTINTARSRTALQHE
jgi:hypothetical protein